MNHPRLLGGAAAILLSLPLLTAPAAAQDATTPSPGDQPITSQGAEGAAPGAAGGSESGAGAQPGTSADAAAGADAESVGPPADALIARVGEREIRGADVQTLLGQVPQPMRSEQSEMLIPLAIDQLILRALILQKASAEGLRDDPDVKALVAESAATAEDEAVVQVWLQRELEKRVTDEAVQRTYSELDARTEQDLPPLEQIRPQVEQRLRLEALGEIRTELQRDTEVTYFDATGNPIDVPSETGATGGGEGAQSPGGEQPQPQQNQ